MSEAELVALAERVKHGDNDAFEQLTRELRGLLSYDVRQYYIPGFEQADKYQVALQGLWKACCDYEPPHHFKSFAGLCIRRLLISTLKAAQRKKHIPISEAFSLDKATFDDASATLHDVIARDEPSVDDRLILEERRAEVIDAIARSGLSENEAASLSLYLEGYSYVEATMLLGHSSAKSHDNALQRAKVKVGRALTALLAA